MEQGRGTESKRDRVRGGQARDPSGRLMAQSNPSHLPSATATAQQQGRFDCLLCGMRREGLLVACDGRTHATSHMPSATAQRQRPHRHRRAQSVKVQACPLEIPISLLTAFSNRLTTLCGSRFTFEWRSSKSRWARSPCPSRASGRRGPHTFSRAPTGRQWCIRRTRSYCIPTSTSRR